MADRQRGSVRGCHLLCSNTSCGKPSLYFVLMDLQPSIYPHTHPSSLSPTHQPTHSLTDPHSPGWTMCSGAVPAIGKQSNNNTRYQPSSSQSKLGLQAGVHTPWGLQGRRCRHLYLHESELIPLLLFYKTFSSFIFGCAGSLLLHVGFL